MHLALTNVVYKVGCPNRGKNGQPKTIFLGNVERGMCSYSSCRYPYRAAEDGKFQRLINESGGEKIVARSKLQRLIDESDDKDIMERGTAHHTRYLSDLIRKALGNIIEDEKILKRIIYNVSLMYATKEQKQDERDNATITHFRVTVEKIAETIVEIYNKRENGEEKKWETITCVDKYVVLDDVLCNCGLPSDSEDTKVKGDRKKIKDRIGAEVVRRSVDGSPVDECDVEKVTEIVKEMLSRIDDDDFNKDFPVTRSDKATEETAGGGKKTKKRGKNDTQPMSPEEIEEAKKAKEAEAEQAKNDADAKKKAKEEAADAKKKAKEDAADKRKNQRGAMIKIFFSEEGGSNAWPDKLDYDVALYGNMPVQNVYPKIASAVCTSDMITVNPIRVHAGYHTIRDTERLSEKNIVPTLDYRYEGAFLGVNILDGKQLEVNLKRALKEEDLVIAVDLFTTVPIAKNATTGGDGPPVCMVAIISDNPNLNTQGAIALACADSADFRVVAAERVFNFCAEHREYWQPKGPILVYYTGDIKHMPKNLEARHYDPLHPDAEPITLVFRGSIEEYRRHCAKQYMRYYRPTKATAGSNGQVPADRVRESSSDSELVTV